MDKLTTYLTLSKKSGNITLGFEETRHNIFMGKIYLVVFTKDISEKTKKGVVSLCEEYNVRYSDIDKEMKEIEFYLGKRSGIIGIKNKGFGNAILKEENYDTGK